MAGNQIERALGVLEQLSGAGEGLALQTLADRLNIPKSATHRMLAELVRLGYVRQDGLTGRYRLSTRLIALGFRQLAHIGADVVQPILDRLAETAGELVRLGVVEPRRLTWIAKSQGARSGLRYDPDMGREAPLFCTASGHAWLACMSDEEALERVRQQRANSADMVIGPNAPRDDQALLACLAQARTRGYAWVAESSAIGMSALAAVVVHPQQGQPLGVLSIAGPSARLPEARIHELAPALIAASKELSDASQASEFFA